MSNMKLSEELTWRGFAKQTTYKDITKLDNSTVSFYFGVDPSASSMTIGNLAAVMMIRCFLKHGHKGTILIGGATGLIGDPDGKSDERNLKELDDIKSYKEGITSQYEKVYSGLEFDTVDNYDWFKDIGYLNFLRDIGKHVPMRQMLGREFIQNRLGEGGSGISYAEFSYVLIQAYDFLHLNREKGITLQLCGSDQWGNSIAGVDLIRRITGNEAHVWSLPLVVNKSTGVKFGKSEEGAIWLDKNLTSPYRFYQFWLNAGDNDVEDYLKIFTEFDKDKVDNIMQEFNQDKSKRTAQKALADSVTTLIHGKETAESLARISATLFGGADYKDLTPEDFEAIKTELPCITPSSRNLVDIIVESGLASSKGEARRFLSGNAIYINGSQINDSTQSLEDGHNINGHAILRRGKNNQAVIQF